VYLRRTGKIATARVPAKILSRRSAVLGAIIVAVAVMLWFALRRDMVLLASPESASPTTQDLSAPVAAPKSTPPATDAQVPPSPAHAGIFTVHLRPLQYDATNALVLARVNEYYAAIAYGLRAVPGLQLVPDEA
jgi:hypothetical protein